MIIQSSPSLRLEAVPAKEVARTWKLHAGRHLDPLIKEAKTRWQLGDTVSLCESEEGQLWLIWDAEAREAIGAFITQIIEGGGEKALEILALAGRDLDRWLPMLPQLEGFARAHGCTLMRAYARFGLQRVLKSYRWKPRQVILERALA